MLPGSYMMVVQYRRSLHIRRPKAGGACGRSWRATLPPSPLAPDPDYADLSAILLNATHAMWSKVSDITLQSDAVSMSGFTGQKPPYTRCSTASDNIGQL